MLKFPINLTILLFQIILAILESIWKAITRREKEVRNEVVLITGSGSGIGKELALQYADLGAIVVCWDVNEENNLKTVNCIKLKGQKAFGFT